MENINKIYKLETFNDPFFPKTKRAKPIQYYVNEEGCHICTSHSPDNKNGYPRVSRKGKRWKLSRLIWTLFRGEIPVGFIIRHTCDDPRCINLDHLIIGTHADNMRDKLERGRVCRGEEHPSSKLNNGAVKIIRNSLLTHAELARKLGVNPKTVWNIRHNKTWKHVSA